jgi:cyclic beta-1,2-glucan synthetase
MYRAGLESILGCRMLGSRLVVDPCIPSRWPGFTIAFRHRSAHYTIVVENPGGVCRGVASVELDDVPIAASSAIPLADDATTHRVRIVLGVPPEPVPLARGSMPHRPADRADGPA